MATGPLIVMCLFLIVYFFNLVLAARKLPDLKTTEEFVTFYLTAFFIMLAAVGTIYLAVN